jgi:hypothetical protein
MSSHPGYDPNNLDQFGGLLTNNKDAPLLNRAVQALYPIGTAGAPFALAIGEPDQPQEAELVDLYRKLGFYTTPDLRMPAAEAHAGGSLADLRVSPLQMADAAAALSSEGVRPVARLALAVNTPQQGWVVLPALGQTGSALSPAAADQAAAQLTGADGKYWQWTGLAQAGEESNTWFIGGTPPNWTATPLAVAVLIEGNYPMSAERIGRQLLQSAMQP